MLLPPVRMVGSVWMIMVATHVSVVISGLVKTAQVPVITTTFNGEIWIAEL